MRFTEFSVRFRMKSRLESGVISVVTKCTISCIPGWPSAPSFAHLCGATADPHRPYRTPVQTLIAIHKQAGAAGHCFHGGALLQLLQINTMANPTPRQQPLNALLKLVAQLVATNHMNDASVALEPPVHGLEVLFPAAVSLGDGAANKPRQCACKCSVRRMKC